MFTVNKADFKDLHNGLCYLRFALERLEPTLHESIMNELRKAKGLLEQGMRGVYLQESDWYNKQHEYFEVTKKAHRFKHSVWSINEVQDFMHDSPYNQTVLKYDGHQVEIKRDAGSDYARWINLWSAADKVIGMSGDSHHCFIEAFYPSSDEPDCLFLSTGS